MADFCKQCSESLFGDDFKELAGLLTETEASEGLLASVLCEGCGPCQVDKQGRCMTHPHTEGKP